MLKDQKGVIGGEIQCGDIGYLVSSSGRVQASENVEFEVAFIMFFLFDSLFLDCAMNFVMFNS